ncbi:hypothetical protein, partial [Neisseria cinerea]|uniref:hypothetical protein n=1 Tax=Neisseria cinerea TaxID=483 RepID=UPI001E3F4336
LPTLEDGWFGKGRIVVIPDLWGKSSDKEQFAYSAHIRSRNPRFVGQVFRLMLNDAVEVDKLVVIPDLWGKSSDITTMLMA